MAAEPINTKKIYNTKSTKNIRILHPN